MNLKQLELKRWTELLQAVRRARHLTHAKRTHLARCIRLDRQAIAGWNKAIAKLTLVNPSVSDEYDRMSSDALEHLAHLEETAEMWRDQEKEVLKRIARVKASKALNKPSAPIEERLKARKKARAKARARASGARASEEKVKSGAVAKAAWLKTSQEACMKIAEQLNGVPISEPQQNAINRLFRNPLRDAAMYRAVIRHNDKDKLLSDVADRFRTIEVKLREVGFEPDDFERSPLTGTLVTF